jgi:hypothetical protein
MSDPKDYFASTEAAFMAGQRNGQELAKKAAEEESEDKEGSSEGGLTMEEIQGMSQEEHIARKAEVDRFLEEQGK